MNKLEEARKNINEIDKEMAKLFTERMEAARNVAEYKREHGLSILDSSRERQLIAKNSEYIKDADIRSYYVQFLKEMMNISKQYQHRLLNGVRVAYSGVEGAFADIAAKRIFPDGQQISYPNFEEAYKAVEKGECDMAVLPIENSFAGEVGQVTDLMFKGRLFVTGVYTLKIAQNLMSVEGATVDGIEKVISHPQALSQCAGYIKKHGFEEEESVNTAVAAKTVAKLGNPKVAAIASRETAKLYGLKLIDHDINESEINFTKFAVFSRSRNNLTSNGGTFILLFTVKHSAGALADAVNVIGKYGFNMKTLRSRPMRDLPWQYYFYVEAEGDENSSLGKEMLSELKNHCDMMKIVGSYASEIDLKGGKKK